MINKILAKLKFNALLRSGTPNCSYGKLTLQDTECFLETDGIFRLLYIEFTNSANIVNTLPDGYKIGFMGKKVVITNIMGHSLSNQNKLFEFKTYFNVIKAHIINWDMKKIELEIDDKNKLDLIGTNETNFEDSTLIIGEETNFFAFNINYNDSIANNVVTGLYRRRPFPNGYSGYYHYYPDEKIYMTGKSPSNQSVPIFNNTKGLNNPKNIKILNKISKTKSRNLRIEGLNKVSHDKSNYFNTKKVRSKIVTKDKKRQLDINRKAEMTTTKAKTKRIKKAGKY